MKLIVNLKLQPTPTQAKSLRATLERANATCNWISEQGWNTQPKPTLKQFALHKLIYHKAKLKFDLTAQMIVRCISKVADAYKLDNKRLRTFKRHGSIAYDDRIIRFTKDEAVNLWTVDGRETIPFAAGDYQRKLLPFRKGEVDLVFRNGNYYLNAVCDVEEIPQGTPKDVLGVDFGIVNVATDSDGTIYSGTKIEEKRRLYAHRRANLQKKQTRSAKRKLKQLAGKQQRFQRNENHCISKTIVLNAQGTKRAISLEDLKGIRDRLTVRRRQRAMLANWTFSQLREFISYKARLRGVTVYAVDPRNSSRECSRCGYTDKANRSNQATFSCKSCEFSTLADFNAALNLRVRGLVNVPNVQSHKASGFAA
jgi:IS605 OrfB family transposase